MKKSKLAITGIGIIISAMLVQVKYSAIDHRNQSTRNNNVQTDSSKQSIQTGIPVLTIGLQATLY